MQSDVWRMIRRRHPDRDRLPHLPGNRDHGLPKERGNLEVAQQMAAQESARTTSLCDRPSDEVSLDEVERIGI